MNISDKKSIIELTLEYPKNPYDGSFLSVIERNPVIIIRYEDDTSAVIDTNKFYADGYKRGFEQGKQNILNKINDLMGKDND